jgi:hypothetical protein
MFLLIVTLLNPTMVTFLVSLNIGVLTNGREFVAELMCSQVPLGLKDFASTAIYRIVF